MSGIVTGTFTVGNDTVPGTVSQTGFVVNLLNADGSVSQTQTVGLTATSVSFSGVVSGTYSANMQAQGNVAGVLTLIGPVVVATDTVTVVGDITTTISVPVALTLIAA